MATVSDNGGTTWGPEVLRAFRDTEYRLHGMNGGDIEVMERDRDDIIASGGNPTVEELIARQRERIAARQARGNRPNPYPVSEVELAIRRPTTIVVDDLGDTSLHRTRLMGDEELRRQYGFDIRVVDDETVRAINGAIGTTENNAQNTISVSTTNEGAGRYTWVNDLPIGVNDPLIRVNDSPNVVNDTQIGVNGSDDSDFVVKLPKMDVTTDPLFNDFLKGNRILKEFVEEWSKPAIVVVKLNIWDRMHYISGSFDWSKTKRGHSYWSSLSTVWRTIVESLGPEGKDIPVEVKKLSE